MADSTCLVLIETSGNQRYVFDTNKRRENVGASELIRRVGGPWLADARRAVGMTEANATLIAASGKVLVLAPDPDVGRALVRHVTLRALREAPGLDVAGIVGEPFDLAVDVLSEQVMDVHARFQQARALRPGPDERFLRLPIVAECRTSGLPAMTIVDESHGRDPASVGPRSLPSAAKFAAAAQGLDRLAAAAGTRRDAMQETLRYLEERAEWVAVVHADGNGLGRMFFDLAAWSDTQAPDGASRRERNDRYADDLRRFSDAVDRCTRWAFRQALGTVARAAAADADGQPPQTPIAAVLPLVLGGDDLTVVCDGDIALPLTIAYLDAFERYPDASHTDVDDAAAATLISSVASALTGSARLAASAGVAIVKRHYPFSFAYDLAEALTHSAKEIKRRVPDAPCSALDFHVLYDSTAADLARIRAGLTRMEPAADGVAGMDTMSRLVAHPYVVTPLDRLGLTHASAWVRRHHWTRTEARVAALRATTTGDAEGEVLALPRGQLHGLRSALFVGRSVAEARYAALRHRYPEGAVAVAALGGDDGLLFWREDDGVHETGLLSALDALDFLPASAPDDREDA